jgi:hypothetical protein
MVADDYAIADVRFPHNGDDAPLGPSLGDQGVGRRNGRADAQLPIADLRLECGQFRRQLRGGVAVAERRANLRCVGGFRLRPSICWGSDGFGGQAGWQARAWANFSRVMPVAYAVFRLRAARFRFR